MGRFSYSRGSDRQTAVIHLAVFPSVASLTEQLNAAMSERASAMEECASWKLKFGDMETQFVAVRGQLEDGIMARAGLENQLRAVREEMEFKKSVLQVKTLFLLLLLLLWFLLLFLTLFYIFLL